MHISKMQAALNMPEANGAEAVTILHRGFHTLGGTSGTMKLQPLCDLCRKWEATVKTLKDSGAVIGTDERNVLSNAVAVIEAEIAKISV